MLFKKVKLCMELQKITENDLKDFFIYITKYSNSVIAKIYGNKNNSNNIR